MKAWRTALLVFVVFMIAKDLDYVPLPYALRAVSQGLCLALGGWWLLQHFSPGIARRYWPVLLYIVAIAASAAVAEFPGFVLLQGLSLCSVIVFFIAYHERQWRSGRAHQQDFVRYIVLTAGLITALSLLFAKLAPTLAYESMFAGFSGYEVRFRGLFGKAGAMGAMSGLVLGFAAISVRNKPLKFAAMASAAACLGLTQSRSFWVASFFAGLCTLWFYFPKWRTRGVVIAATLGLTAAAGNALSLSVDTAWAKRAARLDSVSGLSGRVGIWQEAFAGWRESPWLGYGFTLGATGLPGHDPLATKLNVIDTDPMELSRRTLHNGYVQCLLDTGLIGTLLYLLSMVVALWRLLKFDGDRRYPCALYAIVFLATANGGESVVYSGSVFPSLCFWASTVFALSLRKT